MNIVDCDTDVTGQSTAGSPCFTTRRGAGSNPAVLATLAKEDLP